MVGFFRGQRVRRRALLTTCATISAALVLFTNKAAVAADRAVLPASVPAWANSANYAAPANSGDYVGFRVYLGWNNPAGVLALAQALSDPNNSSYRSYLTAAKFRQQFAPSQAQVGAVQRWLREQGFTVEYTPLNNHYVSAEGTVAQAQAAFGVGFAMYTVKGLILRSPSSDVSIPSALSGIVSGVLGLDDSAQLVSVFHTTGDAPPPAAFVSAEPCSTYWGEKQATGFTNPYGSGTLPYAPDLRISRMAERRLDMCLRRRKSSIVA